jgi:hypothetical protein
MIPLDIYLCGYIGPRAILPCPTFLGRIPTLSPGQTVPLPAKLQNLVSLFFFGGGGHATDCPDHAVIS